MLFGNQSLKNINIIELTKHEKDLKSLIKNYNRKNQELKRSKLSKS